MEGISIDSAKSKFPLVLFSQTNFDFSYTSGWRLSILQQQNACFKAKHSAVPKKISLSYIKSRRNLIRFFSKEIRHRLCAQCTHIRFRLRGNNPKSNNISFRRFSTAPGLPLHRLHIVNNMVGWSNNQNIVGVSGKCGKRNGCSRISGVDSMISMYSVFVFLILSAQMTSCQRLWQTRCVRRSAFFIVFGTAFCETLSGFPPGVGIVSLMYFFSSFALQSLLSGWRLVKRQINGNSYPSRLLRTMKTDWISDVFSMIFLFHSGKHSGCLVHRIIPFEIVNVFRSCSLHEMYRCFDVLIMLFDFHLRLAVNVSSVCVKQSTLSGDFNIFRQQEHCPPMHPRF
jgi:hypothetical protein